MLSIYNNSMKEEAEHHSQVSSQSTMSYEISLSTVPPKNNNNIVSIEQQGPQPHEDEQAHNNKISPKEAARKKWFDEMRGWIMVVAVLVASVTYTSGLSPPGGFWQDDNNHHEAGSPILYDKSPERYTTFFYANATAFMTSLIIIILLMSEKFYCDMSKVVMLYISMVLDLISLMIAYVAGCGRSLSTSIYVIVLAAGVLLFVVYSARFLPYLCSFARQRAPWVEDVVGRDLIPSRVNSSAETRDCDTTQARVSYR